MSIDTPLTPVEQRVIGCLLEKERTTPDQYPLSLKALTTACNQSSNREPVMSLREDEVEEVLRDLASRGLVAPSDSGRVRRYSQLVESRLGLVNAEAAVLALLLLRGPQTVGQLKNRTARLHPFGSLDEVREVLDDMQERDLVGPMPREPGRKGIRYAHLLGGGLPETLPQAGEKVRVRGKREAPEGEPAPARPVLEARLAALEEEVRRLARQVGEIRQELGLAGEEEPGEE